MTTHALRILVVDDSSKLRQLMALILRCDGHVVHTVGTAPEVLAQLERECYELVISDLSLGGNVAGLRLAQTARRVWPKVRFMLATGSAEDLTPAEWARWGVDAFLRKPFTPAQLREAVALLEVGQ
jgi:CheY-like chemotaxis protein